MNQQEVPDDASQADVPMNNEPKNSGKFSLSAPPSELMNTHGVDWYGIANFAKKSIKLLQNTGDKFIDLIETGFRGMAALTGRDMAGVFEAFAEGNKNVKAIVLAIQNEFGLLDGNE